MKHLRKRIASIWNDRKNPMKKLWKWAHAPDGTHRVMLRWAALKVWARSHADNARKNDDHDKRKWWLERQDEYDKKFEEKRDQWIKENKDPKPAPTTGIATPDRPWNPNHRPIAAWMIQWLDKSRAAGWNGILVSGYRSPEYSQQLCYNICGAPSCPGTCAGTASNHTRYSYPGGAIDVSDNYNFAAIQYRIGSPLRNNLPSDRVHFSTSGY